MRFHKYPKPRWAFVTCNLFNPPPNFVANLMVLMSSVVNLSEVALNPANAEAAYDSSTDFLWQVSSNFVLGWSQGLVFDACRRTSRRRPVAPSAFWYDRRRYFNCLTTLQPYLQQNWVYIGYERVSLMTQTLRFQESGTLVVLFPKVSWSIRYYVSVVVSLIPMKRTPLQGTFSQLLLREIADWYSPTSSRAMDT